MCTRTSCRTAASPPPSPMPGVASACGATWPSPGGERTRHLITGPTISTCAIHGRTGSGRPRISRSARSRTASTSTFDLEKITFHRRDADIETRLEIAVSSEDDVDVRRLTITNRGIADAGDRSDQLRRDRARASGRRSGASDLRQVVRRDGVRPPERRICCSSAVRAPPTNPLSSASTSSALTVPVWGAPSSGKPTARVSSAAGGRPPTRSCSTAARCRGPRAPCSIRSARCASACACPPAPSSG